MKASKKPKFDRRRFPRVKAPVYYRPASVFGTKGQAANISLAGVRIYSNKPLKKGQALEIELLLPSGNSLKAIVRIVWISAMPPGSEALYDVGLEFLNIADDVIPKLQFVLEDSSSTE
ncbi:MAG: PilZ domain-containing protein [Candidatus Aminicenantes bacterium]|nr:PilZ domain-containing protein [Candidatus Aminicenantes bacterium]